MAFTLTQQQLVVESNEDGFTEKDVQALCRVCDSTKTQNWQQIGNIGIGFKSVSNVASVVHVQSGPWSFAFKDPLKGDGMGLVTPHHEDFEDLPSTVRTRFTLTLARSNSV